MNYIEVNFIVSPKEPATDILIAELNEYGFESFEETRDGLKAYIQTRMFKPDFYESIPVLMAKDFNISYEKKEIEPQNWNEVWENSFSPVLIAEKCIIRASFHEKKDHAEYDIIINPKMSFGTGHHQTTSLMVEEVLKLDIENKSVADAGCGTAVLAILASKMKARNVFAYDIDEWAIDNSKENVILNNADNITLHKGNAVLLQEKLFNVILANINKNILLADMHVYAKALEKNGELLLSGFFAHDNDELIKAAQNCGLNYFSRNEKENWSLLRFIKTI